MTKIIANLFTRLCCNLIFPVLSLKHFRRLAFIILLFQTCTVFSLQAILTETLDSLANENRVISEPIELHLTSADNPFINSTVSLNHTDAWLFLDNYKPSVVIDSFTSNILINGAQINNGVNCRVAIYSHGSVVMPHGINFKPLTIYTNKNYTGDSLQLMVHTYYNNLGELDNAVLSFKLKRGYMATFADKANGTGYSRVFIAHNEDMMIGTMPEELYGTVSFIRVFKYQWVNKKGKAGWDPHDINATSYYDWNIGGNSSTDVEYVTIRQNAGWPSWDAINTKQDVSHLLGFNEPDRPDQANMTFQEMIDIWPDMLKSGLRIGSPAWSNPWGGNGGTLFDFISKCDELNYRIDFVALHCYWGGKTPVNWYNDLKYIHDVTKRPLWITEWNNGANWTTEWWPDSDRSYTDANAQKQLNDLKGILQVLDTASFIERYFIYDWVQDCRAMVLGDTLTLAGKYYAANPSEIAYNNKKEVIPHWNYSPPTLSYLYLNLSNKVRLDWTNPNGDLCKGYTLLKRINNGNYDTLSAGDDVNVNYFVDPVNSETSGTSTYKLILHDTRGENLTSNEVSFHQFSGQDSIKVGRFMVNNTDWATALFTDKYTDAPLVFLGIPSYNNPFPMTQRVSNIKNNTFKFHFEHWEYLNNPKLTGIDLLAAITLPPGNYDFRGLQAEVKSVGNISRDWTTITFDKPFTTEPVVFCTVVSSSSSTPVMVAVRNITTSGCEICLKPEEAITGFIFPETINYLAIETGHAVIMDKRITVGKSTEGNGLKSNPVVMAFDSTYREPVIFAGLLSSNDNFASTLRHKALEDSKFELYKQRELSYSLTPANEDQFGWLIIDISEDQYITSSPEIMLNSISIYPNPVKDVVYLNFEVPTDIEITDITGHILLKRTVLKSADLGFLPRGIFLLKADGWLPVKFIKN
ncbi:MAG: hypothetical protein JXB00_04260 [Bacteroidales bacterium]|nr:hypothetical protein [Bacteroidales bacterium]